LIKNEVAIIEKDAEPRGVLFKMKEEFVREEDGGQEELLFRMGTVAGADVGTIESVRTIELLLEPFAMGPAAVVGTVEGAKTIELLFRTEKVAIIGEDAELWANWYADGEGAEDDAAAVTERLEF
jgi:hypothetical protein